MLGPRIGGGKFWLLKERRRMRKARVLRNWEKRTGRSDILKITVLYFVLVVLY